MTLTATGVTNPAAGTDTLTVATLKDPAAITSGTYSITAVVGGGGTGGQRRLFRLHRFDCRARIDSVLRSPHHRSSSRLPALLVPSSSLERTTTPTRWSAPHWRPQRTPHCCSPTADVLTPATQAEIQRVLPAGGTVYLLGGTAAIPATVATSLTSLGFVPVRYAGADRFGTALAVADALNDPSTVLLATGVNFPDALAAGPAAAHVHGVVLLTNGSSLTPAVTAYLAAHPGTVYAIGGPAVAADPSATALSGADRYATAAAVASTLFAAPTTSAWQVELPSPTHSAAGRSRRTSAGRSCSPTRTSCRRRRART